jgi:hypothetical protein
LRGKRIQAASRRTCISKPKAPAFPSRRTCISEPKDLHFRAEGPAFPSRRHRISSSTSDDGGYRSTHPHPHPSPRSQQAPYPSGSRDSQIAGLSPQPAGKHEPCLRRRASDATVEATGFSPWKRPRQRETGLQARAVPARNFLDVRQSPAMGKRRDGCGRSTPAVHRRYPIRSVSGRSAQFQPIRFSMPASDRGARPARQERYRRTRPPPAACQQLWQKPQDRAASCHRAGRA